MHDPLRAKQSVFCIVNSDIAFDKLHDGFLNTKGQTSTLSKSIDNYSVIVVLTKGSNGLIKGSDIFPPHFGNERSISNYTSSGSFVNYRYRISNNVVTVIDIVKGSDYSATTYGIEEIYGIRLK